MHAYDVRDVNILIENYQQLQDEKGEIGDPLWPSNELIMDVRNHIVLNNSTTRILSKVTKTPINPG